MGRLKRSERNIRWIEKHCRVPEGKYVGQPLKLAKFQKAEIRRIYDNPHGTRRAIISFGRKNAKTTLAACLLLLHLVGPEARPNSELFSAALSREQAAIIFRLAQKIVRMSPVLRDHIRIIDSYKVLECKELGTFYRALSADASTSFGLSPVFIVHDELGQVKGPRSDLYEALETATAAQESPLSIVISTQAPTDADLLSVLIDDALESNDPKTVVSLYTAPTELDPFAVETIERANPAFSEFMNADEVLAQAHDAQRMPSREAAYRNLVLNQRVEVHSPFVTRSVWNANADAPLSSLRGYPVYAGLDLSEANDLTALVLIAPVDGRWHTHATFWLPETGLRERARKDRVPYDTWYEQGHLSLTPGKSIEHEYIAEHLRLLFDELDIRAIAFDRWNFRHLKSWLVKAGFSDEELGRFVEFGQGFQSMSPALRDLESDLLNERFAHGGHPILTMCAANAVVQSDPAGNRKLAKNKSSGRIDGMVSLTMARGVAATADLDSGGYVEGGVLVI